MEEKRGHRRRPSRPWIRTVQLPLPGVSHRRLRLLVPTASVSKGRQRPLLLITLACAAVFLTFVLFPRTRSVPEWAEWPTNPAEPNTLVFQRADLQRLWLWEIQSGHYPSAHHIPKEIGFTFSPRNPGLSPPLQQSIPLYDKPFIPSPASEDTPTRGIGPTRKYFHHQAQPSNMAYPPRPVPGSVIDLDVVMKHCDFSQQKYVRDCLEVLRFGAALDNGRRVRRDLPYHWRYIYVENNSTPPAQDSVRTDFLARHPPIGEDVDVNAGLQRRPDSEWEPQLLLGPPLQHIPSAALPKPCDPENPRIFHMFWTGPFTDKPYLALLSFLFTQNLGLQLTNPSPDSPVCRPQFWLWVNPGPAASVPNPSALRDMYAQLKSSPWAAPFLHPRFKEVIHFKLWNTTEQLDNIPELKDKWRTFQETLFNSGGHIINVPVKEKPKDVDGTNSTTTAGSQDEDHVVNRMGSKSPTSYDRLSVILSDMARFVLCHRFGGIYLDADTLLLRDWEEMWGWKGAFAYRWSRLPTYNTAVLRMNKNSALGTFLFRTALRNGLDFHPMTISRYMRDAYSEGLLRRLPDALFDPAWLNTENFQRERPPQPYFYDFGNFFHGDSQDSGSPAALGFEGFFRGAFSYHYHNAWWKPFDPARNFPDLGPRFAQNEANARLATLGLEGTSIKIEDLWAQDDVSHDDVDLGWSAVLKRTFEAFIRGERPNAYGEWISW